MRRSRWRVGVMVGRVVCKRGQRLRGMLLVALSLVMLLTSMIPVQAQQQSPAERLDLVPEGCDIPEHRPGEFDVSYDSKEALQAAPKENVVEETAWMVLAEGCSFSALSSRR